MSYLQSTLSPIVDLITQLLACFYRYKQVIGGRLYRRNLVAQASEVRLSSNVLCQMLELGLARSESIHE